MEEFIVFSNFHVREGFGIWRESCGCFIHISIQSLTLLLIQCLLSEKFMEKKSKILKPEGLGRWLRGLVGCLVYCQLDTLHLRRRNLN